MTGPDLRAGVEDALRSAGIDAVGVTSVEPFEEVRASLEDRRARGYHAGMAFTFSDPRRSTEPARLLRNAASMVVGALGYLEERPEPPDGPSGRVARYAWRDHYRDLRRALDAGADVLRDAGHRAMVIADQNGLVDRAAAHRAGIGWWGRNANLLVPGAGSWFVLGSIVTDAHLPTSGTTPSDVGWCRARRLSELSPLRPRMPDRRHRRRRRDRCPALPRMARAGHGSVPPGPPGRPRRPSVRLRRLSGRVPTGPGCGP